MFANACLSKEFATTDLTHKKGDVIKVMETRKEVHGVVYLTSALVRYLSSMQIGSRRAVENFHIDALPNYRELLPYMTFW